MCLAIPVQVEEIEGSEATVVISGVRRKISIVLTPEARVGHYLLIHAGYAIGVIDEEEAKESLKFFEEMAAFAGLTEDSKDQNLT